MSRLLIISVNTEDEVDKIIMNQLNSFLFPSSPKGHVSKSLDYKNEYSTDMYDEEFLDKAVSYKLLLTLPQSVSSSSDSLNPFQPQRIPSQTVSNTGYSATSFVGSPKSRRHRHRNSEMISNDKEFFGSFSLDHDTSVFDDELGDVRHNSRHFDPKLTGTEGSQEQEISFDFSFNDAYNFDNNRSGRLGNSMLSSGDVFLNNTGGLRRNTVCHDNRNGLIDLNVCEYDFLKKSERTLSVPYNTFSSIKEEENEDE